MPEPATREDLHELRNDLMENDKQIWQLSERLRKLEEGRK